MIAVTPCERRALKKFRGYVKKYTQPLDGSPQAVRIHHCTEKHPTLGEAVTIPESDVHHLFTAPLIMAISHTIIDLAAEEGSGELIATMQDFSNFAPEKKRYCDLSDKIDRVRVWGDGSMPKGCRHIDFVSTNHPKIVRYWMVLFDSPHCRAVLLCKQINKAETFEDKKFVGFFSFNPYLVQSIRWRFNLLSCGLGKLVTHWEKSFPLPGVSPREVDTYLKHLPVVAKGKSKAKSPKAR